MKPLLLDPPRHRHEEPDHPFVGSLDMFGLTIDVEQNVGDERFGVAPDGTAWSVRMPAVYGEVRDTVGADGDAVDVFIGPDPHAPFVYVMQTAATPGGKKFDETKSFLGFATKADALATFRKAYSQPGFLLGVTKWSVPAWRAAMLRPEVHRGRMEAPLLKATQQALFTGIASGPTSTHPPYRVHCPRVLAAEGLAPRRWRCAHHETGKDSHPLDEEAARRFMGEAVGQGGTAFATAARLNHPAVRRLAAEGMISVESTPSHYNYEHRVTVTPHGRQVFQQYETAAARKEARAQTSLLKAGMRLILRPRRRRSKPST